MHRLNQSKIKKKAARIRDIQGVFSILIHLALDETMIIIRDVDVLKTSIENKSCPYDSSESNA